MKKFLKRMSAAMLAVMMSVQLFSVSVGAESEEVQLFVDDPVADASKMTALNDWGRAPYGWGLWSTFGCSAAQDVFYTNSVDTYAEYQSGKGRSFTSASMRIAVERSGYGDNEDTAIAGIKSAMLASMDGESFSAIDADNISVTAGAIVDSNKKQLFTAEMSLPTGTKALKIMPNVGAWIFFLTGVKIYGTEALRDEDLLVEDSLKDTSKMSDENNWGVASADWSTWSYVGLAKPQDVLYAQGADTYAVYRTDGRKNMTYAEFRFALEQSGFDRNMETMVNAVRRSIKASLDQTDFEAVPVKDIILDRIELADINKCSFIAKVFMPEGTKAVKIESPTSNGWHFFFIGANIYGKEYYQLNKLELKVNGSVSELASGTVSGEATIWNRSGSAVTPAFITAIFEQDGSLKAAAIAAVQEIGIGEEKTLTAVISDYVYTEGDSVRYFVFKNANTIQPMFPLEDLNQ